MTAIILSATAGFILGALVMALFWNQHNRYVSRLRTDRDGDRTADAIRHKREGAAAERALWETKQLTACRRATVRLERS